MLKHKARKKHVIAATECNAEQALAALLNQHLNAYCKRLTLHPSHAGSHAEAITGALRLAKKEGYSAIVVIVDYEEGTYEQYRTQEICSEADIIKEYSLGKGSSIIFCKKVVKGIMVYSIIWRPRSEAVLEALKGSKLAPKAKKKVKSKIDYVKKMLEESAVEIIEDLAAHLASFLC